MKTIKPCCKMRDDLATTEDVVFKLMHDDETDQIMMWGSVYSERRGQITDYGMISAVDFCPFCGAKFEVIDG